MGKTAYLKIYFCNEKEKKKQALIKSYYSLATLEAESFFSKQL